MRPEEKIVRELISQSMVRMAKTAEITPERDFQALSGIYYTIAACVVEPGKLEEMFILLGDFISNNKARATGIDDLINKTLKKEDDHEKEL